MDINGNQPLSKEMLSRFSDSGSNNVARVSSSPEKVILGEKSKNPSNSRSDHELSGIETPQESLFPPVGYLPPSYPLELGHSCPENSDQEPCNKISSS